MDPSQNSPQLGRITNRLAQYQQQISPAPHSDSTPTKQPTMAARDPITCHCLNTLSGTPAANLPVTLTLLSTPASATSGVTFRATTNADGRVANWTPVGTASESVPAILAALPAADSKTNWSVRFEVGPWYEAQGVESFWPEVEVKFTVKGRGREGEEGWRHYHVPVLLGPWNYSTYRGS
ncbi:Hydroxyisourate hydrolase [Penicillium paradoxum]|uniref:Hydroxyisourate hydrolase n=1 Tax=Penicillium paradoxum TaxID=176176 RepID=UPI0025474A3B|nr:Hydroxyisourate hydrolase [Penicillium paradoxum]KAJ5793619.1 Hydroxyisourate hydrolase [Penicillium paradoxum]